MIGQWNYSRWTHYMLEWGPIGKNHPHNLISRLSFCTYVFTITSCENLCLSLHDVDIWLVTLAHHEISIYMHMDWIRERKDKNNWFEENNNVMWAPFSLLKQIIFNFTVGMGYLENGSRTHLDILEVLSWVVLWGCQILRIMECPTHSLKSLCQFIECIRYCPILLM